MHRPEGLRTVRGGSYGHDLKAARSSFRSDAKERRTQPATGLRPARSLEGGGP